MCFLFALNSQNAHLLFLKKFCGRQQKMWNKNSSPAICCSMSGFQFFFSALTSHVLIILMLVRCFQWNYFATTRYTREKSECKRGGKHVLYHAVHLQICPFFASSAQTVRWHINKWHEIQWLHFCNFKLTRKFKNLKNYDRFGLNALFVWCVFWVLMPFVCQFSAPVPMYVARILMQKESLVQRFPLTSFVRCEGHEWANRVLILNRTPLPATKTATDKIANLPLKCAHFCVIIIIRWRFRDYNIFF